MFCSSASMMPLPVTPKRSTQASVTSQILSRSARRHGYPSVLRQRDPTGAGADPAPGVGYGIHRLGSKVERDTDDLRVGVVRPDLRLRPPMCLMAHRVQVADDVAPHPYGGRQHGPNPGVGEPDHTL